MDHFNYILSFCALIMVVPLLSMQGQKALGFHQKYLNLCSEDERRSYRFGTRWGWVINDIILIFGWAIPLNSAFMYRIRGEGWCSALSGGCEFVQLTTEFVLTQRVPSTLLLQSSSGCSVLLHALSVIDAGHDLGMSRSYGVVPGGGQAWVWRVKLHQRPLVWG